MSTPDEATPAVPATADEIRREIAATERLFGMPVIDGSVETRNGPHPQRRFYHFRFGYLGRLPSGKRAGMNDEPSQSTGDTTGDKAPRLRRSIMPTYDSRRIGPPYTIQSRVNGVFVDQTHPAFDPFHSTRISVNWRDILRAWVRGKPLVVEVSVSAHPSIMEDVLELDCNYLGSGSTRRADFEAGIETALGEVGEEGPR